MLWWTFLIHLHSFLCLFPLSLPFPLLSRWTELSCAYVRQAFPHGAIFQSSRLLTILRQGLRDLGWPWTHLVVQTTSRVFKTVGLWYQAWLDKPCSVTSLLICCLSCLLTAKLGIELWVFCPRQAFHWATSLALWLCGQNSFLLVKSPQETSAWRTSSHLH